LVIFYLEIGTGSVVRSVAKRVRVTFLWQLWSWSHDLGSTPTHITLLRPWIRRFQWFRTSIKLTGKKSKKKPGQLGNGELLNGCGFVQDIMPPSLSRDRRLKTMEQNKQTNTKLYDDLNRRQNFLGKLMVLLIGS